MRLMLLLICLTLCGSIVSARAELQLQSKMDAMCRPSAPATYSIERWKPQGACTNDCFVSRLKCSNGKTIELQSAIHPGTTDLQMLLYYWAPWSFIFFLVPFCLIVGLATAGSNFSRSLLALNVLFAAYTIFATLFFYASIVGNPWSEWIWLERIIFLNPYTFGMIMFFFLVVNLPAVWHSLEDFFYRHSAMPAIVPFNRMHTNEMHAVLMPNIYEVVDPRETTSYYERETDRLRAYKGKLDAQTALAQAYIRHTRTRNRLND
jgi:hypothetical protein